jgi:hypothetical protein
MRARDSFGGISPGCSGTGSCGATCGRGDVVLFVEVESVLDFVHGRHLEVLSMQSDLLVLEVCFDSQYELESWWRENLCGRGMDLYRSHSSAKSLRNANKKPVFRIWRHKEV